MQKRERVSKMGAIRNFCKGKMAVRKIHLHKK